VVIWRVSWTTGVRFLLWAETSLCCHAQSVSGVMPDSRPVNCVVLFPGGELGVTWSCVIVPVRRGLTCPVCVSSEAYPFNAVIKSVRATLPDEIFFLLRILLLEPCISLTLSVPN
jgi:hypothetical protein